MIYVIDVKLDVSKIEDAEEIMDQIRDLLASTTIKHEVGISEESD